ncbi:MAG: hypothetical protein EPO07_06220 [Verrucomicrobia bacterium]|nr:MAG: hypothetical protein EPO07_06220 [Verrucomicrobiota bacterium]
MNAPLDETRVWSRGRWWAMVVLVFAVQLGLIFALGDRKPIVPRMAVAPQQMQLAPARSELLALLDPTLFALPHARGFGAAAWLRPPQLGFSTFRFSDPGTARFELAHETLGDSFRHFVETSSFGSFALEINPPPEQDAIEFPPAANPPAAASRLQILGDLAQRVLKNPPTLPAMPADDLLTNSVVQTLVDADGRVFSAVLLQPLGSKPPTVAQAGADHRALELARAAEFSAINRRDTTRLTPDPTLTRGLMIFEWHTEPVAATNYPSAP